MNYNQIYMMMRSYKVLCDLSLEMDPNILGSNWFHQISQEIKLKE